MSNHRRGFYGRLLCGTAAISLMAAGAARAEDQQTTSFNIAPQPLSSALNEFATQSKTAVLFTPELTGKTLSPGLTEVADAETALRRMLAGTGLGYRRNGDTFIIMRADDPQSGSAAGDGADAGTVEALIVTAQKREEDIQDVPIAISAFSQEQLENSQIAGGPDLMTQVPNFTFTKTNFSSYSIQLRGIGTQAISATTDPAVAVAFNNTPFIRNRFFEQEFYDLQRVEVLRGPQGTLYGRNATAGVVNIISQKPKFTYEAKLSGDVANYNSTRIEGMINVPLVDDIVALRLAGAWTKRDGYAINEITGNPIDGRDLWSTRLSLRLAPTDALDLNLIWEHFREDDDRIRSGKQLCKRHQPETIAGIAVPWGQTGPGSTNGGLYDQTYSQGCEAASLYSPDSFQAPNGLRLPYYRALIGVGLPIVMSNPDGTAFDPYASTTQSRDLRVIESTVDPVYKAETNLVELQASFDMGEHLTLSSETAYLSDTLFSSQDYNRFNTRPGAFGAAGQIAPQWLAHGVLDAEGFFVDPQIGRANRLVAMDLSTATSRQFSQEFRLASDYDGPVNFSLGANFLRYDTMEKYYVFINTLSLYAAQQAHNIGGIPAPYYVPGVTDNSHCLINGNLAPDPYGVEDIQSCVPIDPNPITSLDDTGHNYFLSKNPYKLISYAVFGETYYNITDSLKLTAGLRWTVDKKEAPRIPSWVLAANKAGYPVAEVIEQEWREPTGRLTLDWKPALPFTDETLLYASYAHGYKAGGANPPAAGVAFYYSQGRSADFRFQQAQQQALFPKRFDPEFVDAFELGSKNTLSGGKLTLNAAAFYYDYQGYQISQIVNRAAINQNFDAQVWGLELEADWRPIENLRFGLKLGYEDTELAEGSRAIDTMDRSNGGKPDENGISWFVTTPFPTMPANCILPTYILDRPDGQLPVLGGPTGGFLSVCEDAYVLGLDPLTGRPYIPNPPTQTVDVPTGYNYPGYPGFDPLTAPNGGAGIFKDLSGNELPNAPHYTVTLTADYTVPLPNDWLATLHTDLYMQSEAWTRIFNTEGYDKLKAYTNVNLAAIFTNEDRGWKVMAYVKNVFDRDSITGAFLNSDDTGLTTNVFLTEPRLYGLRVTREFQGGPWWTGVNPSNTGPYPLTVELMGQVQRQEAEYGTLGADLFDAFPDDIAPLAAQHTDLDWGDGRQLRLTFRPKGSPWKVAAAYRYGRTNNGTSRTRDEVIGPKMCWFPLALPIGRALCDPTYSAFGGPPGEYYAPGFLKSAIDWADSAAISREEHTVVDFAVGRDFGIGGLESHVSLGVRFANLKSFTAAEMAGVPDSFVPEGWAFKYSHWTRYEASIQSEREFEGAGPMLTWDASKSLLGGEETGRLGLEWSVGAGVLFGKQKTTVTGEGYSRYTTYLGQSGDFNRADPTPYNFNFPERADSVTVPVVDLSLGLSYEIQRIKVGAGYRWERYLDAIDAGFEEREEFDRTFDGPYFKIAVGFGG